MELQHVNAKIYVDGDLPVDPERFIPVFHDWVRDQDMAELLIDVADYRHVPQGPGVLLVGHEADYALDHSDGKYGLRYNRKSACDGTNAVRFDQALRSAAQACLRLEAALGADGLSFSRTSFELYINDRACAPNTPETLAACQPEFEAYLASTTPGGFELVHHADPRGRFGFTVTAKNPLDFDHIT
jgi:hypothetical protein